MDHLTPPGDAVWGLAERGMAAREVFAVSKEWGGIFTRALRTSPHCSSRAATAKHFSFSSRRCLAFYNHIRGSAGPT